MHSAFTRRHLLAAAGSLCFATKLRAAPSPAPQPFPSRDQRERTRSFWVLKLLYPTSLIVRPLGTARLHCASLQKNWIVEGSESLSITPASPPVRITGPGDAPVNCVLEIPNVIRRSYFGRFSFTTDSGLVIPVVTMDCETAAGSIVQAELPVYAAPVQALAAQAVVSRSILCAAAAPRHNFADFCDTTHCQFLRSPAVGSSPVAHAIHTTRGAVLFQRDRVFPARYSAACGGATESGFDGDFQYLSVACEICRRTRTARRGHGWGLCQEGALALARLGWTCPAILAKYYPNAIIARI